MSATLVDGGDDPIRRSALHGFGQFQNFSIDEKGKRDSFGRRWQPRLTFVRGWRSGMRKLVRFRSDVKGIFTGRFAFEGTGLETRFAFSPLLFS
jgi:hypothetical protein